MKTVKLKKFRVRTAGHPDFDEIYISPYVTLCGEITNGVGIRLNNTKGGFVADFEDLEKAYFAAKEARQQTLPEEDEN